MTEKAVALTDDQALRTALDSATTPQLCVALQHVRELIEERRSQTEQYLLERKGKRVLSDMRALMAKAGISMEELQAVLPK